MKNILPLFLLLSVPYFLSAQYTQQGPKLIGTGSNTASSQGNAVAISADGNTMVESSIYDGNDAGAVWVFTRTAGVWSQQGTKLVGTGGVGGFVYQGTSVAISADGNTIIEGAYGDSNSTGAAWVFTRTGGVWTQQGPKLVGSGSVSTPVNQGSSVALSADGLTAFVGGNGDNNGAGAVWMFVSSGSVWTQQGTKIVPTGNTGNANFGSSLALSADGSTLAIGGNGDNGSIGAIWVYANNGGVYSQQGNKLIGSDGIDASAQGSSVAISSDGNTIIIGGPEDFNHEGAAWIFTRSNGTWSQQGAKIYAEVDIRPIKVGRAVAITPDGNTAFIGGPGDSGTVGTFWIYEQHAGVWSKVEPKMLGTGAAGLGQSYQGWSIAVSSEGTVVESGPYDSSSIGAVWVFHGTPPPVGISEVVDQATGLTIWQNVPNPFEASTNIKFEISQATNIKLSVYDNTGREVSVVVNERLDAGIHQFQFDGSSLSNGIYFYKLQADGYAVAKKMVLMR